MTSIEEKEEIGFFSSFHIHTEEKRMRNSRFFYLIPRIIFQQSRPLEVINSRKKSSMMFLFCLDLRLSFVQTNPSAHFWWRIFFFTKRRDERDNNSHRSFRLSSCVHIEHINKTFIRQIMQIENLDKPHKLYWYQLNLGSVRRNDFSHIKPSNWLHYMSFCTPVQLNFRNETLDN